MGAERGAMAIRNITATAVIESDLSKWLGRALLASWPMAAIFCLTPLLRRRLITPGRALVLLAGLAIVAGAMTPQPLLGQMIGPAQHFSSHALAAVQNTVRTAVRKFMPEEAPQSGPPISGSGPDRPAGRDAANGAAAASKTATAGKARVRTHKPAAPPGPVFTQAASAEHLGHLAAYIVLSGLAFMTYGRPHPIRVILALCLFAAASEALQSFIITRDAEWMDLVFNGLGIVGGFFVAYSFAILLNHRLAFSR
jgi:VanZ family protein